MTDFGLRTLLLRRPNLQSFAAIVPVHADVDVANDTIEAVRRYVTDDVICLIDAASGDLPGLDADSVVGFRQGEPQGSQRNRLLGLDFLYRKFPGKDWYLWIEYDCVVANDIFKVDLEMVSKQDVWVVGNDCRVEAGYDLPYLSRVLGSPILLLGYTLGACVFHRGEFLQRLVEEGLYQKIVNRMSVFSQVDPPELPYGKYDFGEHLIPTLALHFGGKIQGFASFDNACQFIDPSDPYPYWSGEFARYPLRCRPYLTESEIFPGRASILHPAKTYDDPVRAYYRHLRQREIPKACLSLPKLSSTSTVRSPRIRAESQVSAG